MELIQSYKNKAAVNSPHTTLRQSVLTFIHKNADAFEALTRSAYPFGGNWRAANQYATRGRAVRKTDDQIARVQQQVEELTQVVNRLSHQINAIQSAQSPAGITPTHLVGTNHPATPSSEVGLNRFRALQTKPLANS